MIEGAAIDNGVDAAALLALVKAESELDPYAERWGDRTDDAIRYLLARDYPALEALVAELERRGLGADVSFGLTQMTVRTAAGYGYGDGSDRLDNVLAVRAAMFERELALNAGARHFASCLVGADDYADPVLQGLIKYNSGGFHPEGDAYWQKYAGNVRRYQDALAWARGIVGGR